MSYLDATKKDFPHLIDELEGYARGANVEFTDLWILSLENEFDKIEHCTTVITNCGRLIGHNEDWNIDSKDSVCILKKTVGELTIFELFYYNTLGGNSVSINSNGILQTVNSLLTRINDNCGIPRNVFARWLSETNCIKKSFKEMSNFKLSSGYNYNIIDINNGTWNIETSASNQVITKIKPPFVHTNHYLFELKEHDASDSTDTFTRYKFACDKVQTYFTLDQMKKLLSDNSKGKDLSIFNEKTIARTIIDVSKTKIYIWLLREQDKGWIEYDLDFMI